MSATGTLESNSRTIYFVLFTISPFLFLSFLFAIFINLSIWVYGMPQAVLIRSDRTKIDKQVKSDKAIEELEHGLEHLKSKEFKLFQDIEKKKMVADTLSESIQLLEESLHDAGDSRRVRVGGWWLFGGTKMSSQEAKEHLSKMKGDRALAHNQLYTLNLEMSALKSEISKLERT